MSPETRPALSTAEGEATALLVEDEPDFLWLINHHLTAMGFVCTSSVDGLQAQMLLESARFDVVVLDMLLPGLDGAGLLSWLRARADGWGPAVVVTSIVNHTALTRELADVVVMKPFRHQDLVAAVKQAQTIQAERNGR